MMEKEEENNGDQGLKVNDDIEESETLQMKQIKKFKDGNDSAQEDYSSDEEYEQNRIGDVPLEWYDDLDHVGYNIAGKKIGKSDELALDSIDKLIKSRDDPMFRRTIFDYKNQETIVLTNKELNLVKRMVECKFVNETPSFDAEPEYKAYFSSKILDMPVHTSRLPSKKSFIPNLAEKRKIIEIIKGIRQGKIKMSDENESKIEEADKYYLLWGDSNENEDDTQELSHRRKKRHIPAPKMIMPGHALSYHPPSEYLFDDEEAKKYEDLPEEEREKIIKPTDFKKLRYVSNYENLIREQFERCLDLYLCTRVQKQRLNIDPESLVPKLPQPKELRPFPNILALSYFGHQGQVRSISLSPNGDILASGDNKGVLKLWEVETTKCLLTLSMSTLLGEKDVVISKVKFNPKFDLLAVSTNKYIFAFFIGQFKSGGDRLAAANCQNLFFTKVAEEGQKKPKRKLVDWSITGEATQSYDIMNTEMPFIKLEILDPHVNKIKDIAWHPKGLYLVTVDDTKSKKKYGQVLIHHFGRKDSQKLFSLTQVVSKVDVQAIAFHPFKPILFVASKQHIFCQDLVRKKLVKRLKGGSKWIASLKVHSSGDHLIVGGYDKKVNWFDLDLKDEAFKSMKFHSKAVRSVALHPKHPLMATASDDGSVHVFHSRVYTDLMRNAMIVPVKKLEAHYIVAEVGVFELVFHPTQPWLFSCGGDTNIHMFQNIP